jgi:hypothetical protein
VVSSFELLPQGLSVLSLYLYNKLNNKNIKPTFTYTKAATSVDIKSSSMTFQDIPAHQSDNEKDSGIAKANNDREKNLNLDVGKMGSDSEDTSQLEEKELKGPAFHRNLFLLSPALAVAIFLSTLD